MFSEYMYFQVKTIEIQLQTRLLQHGTHHVKIMKLTR